MTKILKRKGWLLGATPEGVLGERLIVERKDNITNVELVVTVRFLDNSRMVIKNSEDINAAQEKILFSNKDTLGACLKRTSKPDDPFFRMSIQDDFIAEQKACLKYGESAFQGKFFDSSTPPRRTSNYRIKSIIFDLTGMAAGLYLHILPVVMMYAGLLAMDVNRVMIQRNTASKDKFERGIWYEYSEYCSDSEVNHGITINI